MHILLTEDHGVVREGLRQMLSKEDGVNHVETAVSANEALHILSSGLRPDILLTDLHLGDLSGIELVSKAKALIPELKAALLTIETDPRYLSEAFRAGALGYILKEADADELMFGLRKIARGRHFICSGLTKRLGERLMKERPIIHTDTTDIELSSREQEILDLIANGYTNSEIADRIFTSRRTVEGHRLSMISKTGVRNTPELIKFAMLHGLLQAAK